MYYEYVSKYSNIPWYEPAYNYDVNNKLTNELKLNVVI